MKRGNPEMTTTKTATVAGASASDTQNIEDRMNKRMDEMGVRMKAMMEKLNEMSVGKPENRVRLDEEIPETTNRHNNPPPQRQVQSVTQSASTAQVDMINFLELYHQEAAESRFMQATSLLKTLYGSEGRSRVTAYFRHFESITYNWSSRRRAYLISNHLEGAARLAFDALGPSQQEDYEMIKAAILSNNANTHSLRSHALQEVFAGIRQKQGESLMTYGLRVLSTVRDSMLPDTSEEQVEDMAASHFLQYMRDPTIHKILILHKPSLTFHELLDQAVVLSETRNSTGYFGYSPSKMHREPTEQHQERPTMKCYNCDKTGHRARDCRESKATETRRVVPQQNRQSNFRSSTRTNMIEASDPLRELTEAALGRKINSLPPQCQAIVSSSEDWKATDESSRRRLEAWKTEVAPLGPQDPDWQSRKGITHKLRDMEGRYSDILIGTPRGPKALTTLKVYGTEVNCLADAGAEVSLISRDCLRTIVDTAKLNEMSLQIHPPVFQECRAANESPIQFIAAITLPVTRGDTEVWIELQVPTTPLPQSIILGTNALQALGIEVVDTVTGEKILKTQTSQRKQITYIGENEVQTLPAATSVRSTERISLGGYYQTPVKGKTDMQDGSYLFSSGEDDSLLVSVKNGEVNIPLRNRDGPVRIVEADTTVGFLDPIVEAYDSSDIISTNLAEELIKPVEASSKLNSSLASSMIDNTPNIHHP